MLIIVVVSTTLLKMKQIDTKWFIKTISNSECRSIRGLARAMTGRNGKLMDQAQLTRSLYGEREWRLEEIEQIAKILDVSVIEVLKRVGLTGLSDSSSRAWPASWTAPPKSRGNQD